MGLSVGISIKKIKNFTNTAGDQAWERSGVWKYSPSGRPKRGLFKVMTGFPRSFDFSPAGSRRFFPGKSLWESCIQRLMKSLLVVEPEKAMDSGSGFSNGFILTQINGFIFE